MKTMKWDVSTQFSFDTSEYEFLESHILIGKPDVRIYFYKFLFEEKRRDGFKYDVYISGISFSYLFDDKEREKKFIENLSDNFAHVSYSTSSGVYIGFHELHESLEAIDKIMEKILIFTI